jgi:hypothetical protein
VRSQLVLLQHLSHLNSIVIDEFDVFMDAVNRRISMKMMVRGLQCSALPFA